MLVIAISQHAMASGFAVFEQGAKATGAGGAFSATADDPSAIFYNVAGIAYQRKTDAMLGGTIITFKNQFKGSNNDFPGPDVTAKYEDHVFALPNAYLIMPVGKNWTLGVGQFVAFGLRTHWENQNTFAGRFISQDVNVKTVSIQPSIAWKTDSGKFAIGAGAEYRGGNVELNRNLAAVNPFTLQVADIAHVRIRSDNVNDAWGYNVGVMFRPTDKWSVGLNYRADMTIDYKGKADFTQIPTGNPQFDGLVALQIPPDQNVKTSLDFPAFYHIGVATTMIPTWTLEVDGVMQGWSSQKQLIIDFENPATPDSVRVQNWKDTWSYRLGATKQVNQQWQVRLGALYDESPQPVGDVGPILPDSDRLGISFGLGYDSGKWHWDFSELYLPFYDRSTLGQSHDNFNGTYETTANLITVDVGYRF